MEIISVEFTKLIKQKSIKVFMILYAIAFVFMAGIYLLGENLLHLSLFNESQFVGVMLSSMMGFLLPLMTIYLVSTSFVADFTKGTIKNMFLLPLSKTKIYTGKIAAIQLFVGALLGFQLIITSIISIIQDGFMSLEATGNLLLSYLGAFFILGLINIIGANISLLVQNTGLSIIVAYVGYIGLTIINAYVPRFENISIPTLINNYSSIISRGVLSLFVTMVSYYMILFIVGLLLFEKKEESLCQFD